VDKIAIIQPTHLGDMLCSVPLYRALRHAWPGAEIIFAGSEATRPCVQRFGAYLDRQLVVEDLLDDLTAGQAEWLAGALRGESLDLVVALDFRPPTVFWDGPPADGGSEPSAVAVTFEDNDGLRAEAEDLLVRLARRVSARCAAGLADRGIGQGRHLAIPCSYRRPVPTMLLDLAAALGAPSDDISLEFPLTAEDVGGAATILNGLPLAGPVPLVGLHPGAANPRDRWPHDRFAAVGDLMAERYGAQIVVTGTGPEAPVAAAVVRAMHHQDRVVNLCGQTSLGCFAALVDRMDLLISNDTGAAHVARARARPTVVICSHPVIAAQWFDWGDPPRRTVAPPDGDQALYCTVGAMLAIPLSAVAAAADDLLTGQRSGPLVHRAR
jgi:ADP-heptose:LPS heptosyltransferase